MKAKLNNSLGTTLLLIVALFSFTNIIAQEKTKKELKAEAKLEKQKQIALLVDSKEFVFEVKTVLPQGSRSVEVSGEGYSVAYSADTINSYLPYFGRGFAIGYGGDNGLNFKGKPEKFDVEKTKKAYIIKTEVKIESDSFSFLLSVYFDGGAYLSVSSNNRSSISYNGKIDVLKKK